MNPTIRIQHAKGNCTIFELDEHIVLRELTPSRLLEFMMAFYQAETFTDISSLDLLPLTGDLAQLWQAQSHLSWTEKNWTPTVEWHFEERMIAAVNANGPPIAIVYGNVNLPIFAHVTSQFFGNASVITSVIRC